jgi:hypothetical protein
MGGLVPSCVSPLFGHHETDGAPPAAPPQAPGRAQSSQPTIDRVMP